MSIETFKLNYLDGYMSQGIKTYEQKTATISEFQIDATMYIGYHN